MKIRPLFILTLVMGLSACAGLRTKTQCKIQYRMHGSKEVRETRYMPKDKAVEAIKKVSGLPGFGKEDMGQWLVCR